MINIYSMDDKVKTKLLLTSLKKSNAIYAVWYSNTCLYVGASSNLLRRIGRFLWRKNIAAENLWLEFIILGLRERKLNFRIEINLYDILVKAQLSDKEQEYNEKYNPLLNRSKIRYFTQYNQEKNGGQ